MAAHRPLPFPVSEEAQSTHRPLPFPVSEEARPLSPLAHLPACRTASDEIDHPLSPYKSMKAAHDGIEAPAVASPWKQAVEQVKAFTPQAVVNPIVHVATALLAMLAGCVNAIGIGLFSTTIGNVTGLVTKLAVETVDTGLELVIVMQFLSFFLGSLLSGVLISSRKVGMGTELYGVVLMLVSALIFAGWASAAWPAPGVAQCLLAAAMALQNGMLTKHAHAVVRTTHMTGITTDVGVIIGHQLGRWLHDLALRRRMVEPDSPTRRAAITHERLKEWTQLKLLSLLLVSFFGGGLLGFAIFRRAGTNALLLPAVSEAAMGLGYFLYRMTLRPRWKRLMIARRAGASEDGTGKAPAPAEPAEAMEEKA